MKFDKPAGRNSIDQLRVIGKPVIRVDGNLKVTGTATYAYEQNSAGPGAAYGVVLGAAIAKGRIASIDTTRAEAASGVLKVLTALNAGKLDKGEFYAAHTLAGSQADHYHQAIAFVVANTLEQARTAAALILVKSGRRACLPEATPRP